MVLTLPERALPYIRQHRSEIDPLEYGAACRDDVCELVGLGALRRPGSVLDIGAGLGGPSVFLQRACTGTLYVVDGTGWSDWRVGYRRRMAPFNDLELTREILEANGVDDYVFLEVAPGRTPMFPPVDNVVSLLSWCWHYPPAAYLDRVVRALKPGGRLIVDVRRGHDVERELERGGLSYVTAVREVSGHKGDRQVWER